jgi:hypothetical protein
MQTKQERGREKRERLSNVWNCKKRVFLIG